MAALIEGPFATVLEGRRERFNTLFARARRTAPTLDGAALRSFLGEMVAPVVDRVAAVAPARVDDVGEVLYELSLELIAKDVPNRWPGLAAGWRELFSGLPRQLASSPGLLAAAGTNALYNLATTPGSRPQEWIQSMLQLGEIAPDGHALLDAGKVAAWRSGMAHYRAGALEIAAGLEPRLARAALGLSPSDESIRPEAVLGRLRADPWLSPATAASPAPAAPELAIVGRVGAFRGFGGPFLSPPVVMLSDGEFFAGDGEACWVIHADLFGATLNRAGSLPRRTDTEPDRTFRVKHDGTVLCGRHRCHIQELENPTSWASDGTTLAVTIQLSHAVTFVALREAA